MVKNKNYKFFKLLKIGKQLTISISILFQN